jgi:hypothetical protein
LSIPKGVVNGNSNNASVTVTYPSGFSGPYLQLSLKLVRISGTGSAQFSGNNATLYQTSQTGQFNVQVNGTQTSSTADNMQLQATFYNGETETTLATANLSVIWVTMSMHASGTIATDNDARNVYFNGANTYSLGEIEAGINGAEFVGTVQPSNFTDSITLVRTIVNAKAYRDTINGSTEVDPGIVNPDTSDPGLRDDLPAPNGIVYDLDRPGINTSDLFSRANGTISRIRQNFQEWAVYGGKRASDNLCWYNRSSAKKDATSGSITFEHTFGTDNTAGSGGVTPNACGNSTTLTWDLN